MNENETVDDGGDIKTLLVEYAKRIQSIDDEMKGLREDKRDILKDAKGDGINTRALNAAIAAIRKGDGEMFDVESYEEILKEAAVIF